MIPINIGVDSGAAFGSNPELSGIEVHSKYNFRAFRKWNTKNPSIYQNDSLFVRMITIIKEYIHLKLNVRDMVPTLSQSLTLVHRNMKQTLHPTHLGKLLVVPIYDDSIDLFSVLYSDSNGLCYDMDAIIDTTSFVTINIRVLEELIIYYTSRDININSLVSREITVNLMGMITNYAIFNSITGIEDAEAPPNPNQSFRVINIGKLMYTHRRRIKGVVTNLDMTPLDIMRSVPVTLPMGFNFIEDNYIDNLLWINLLSYRNIINRCKLINRDKVYKKYDSSYSLYRPRGRGDKYFSSCTSGLLDMLEDIDFI